MATRRILALGLGILGFGGRKKWWTGGELNSRHRDFQSRYRTGGIPILPPVLTCDKVCE
jgi:hypothetical protein